MTIVNTKEVIQYWQKMRFEDGFTCPTVALFRLLAYAGFSSKGKRVLEIGFGADGGANLLEFQKRGAQIMGVDINQSYIDGLHKYHPLIPLQLMNAGTDEYPFDVNFDLIFHANVIYYLTDEEIEFHFERSYANLTEGGYLCFQFIENDLTMDIQKTHQNLNQINFDLFKNASTDKIFRGETNPLRVLDINWLLSKLSKFKLIATKTNIESYTNDESIFRIDRYLLLRK